MASTTVSVAQNASAQASLHSPQQSPPSQESISQNVDLAISLSLHLWPALTLAVSEQWGGPDSASKRDWLAGAISDLFASRPDTDEMDIEDMLLQVLGDEFECQLEDDSEIAVAAEICRLRRCVLAGRFGEVEALYQRWSDREKKGGREPLIKAVKGTESDEEDDDDTEDEEGGVVVGEDIEMQDAPSPVSSRTKAVPEVDDEGFTKVASNKKKKR